MKKLMTLAAIAALALGVFALEHDTPQTSGDYAKLTAGEKVYAGNVAVVCATNGLAYAVNTAAVGSTLTVCGVFQHTADAGEAVTVKRGGFILESVGNIGKAEIGSTAYSISTNAWTVTKTSGGKTVGKVADVRDDGSVVVIIGR